MRTSDKKVLATSYRVDRYFFLIIKGCSGTDSIPSVKKGCMLSLENCMQYACPIANCGARAGLESNDDGKRLNQ